MQSLQVSDYCRLYVSHALTLRPPQETFLAPPLLALQTGGRFGEESAKALSYTSVTPHLTR